MGKKWNTRPCVPVTKGRRVVCYIGYLSHHYQRPVCYQRPVWYGVDVHRLEVYCCVCKWGEVAMPDIRQLLTVCCCVCWTNSWDSLGVLGDRNIPLCFCQQRANKREKRKIRGLKLLHTDLKVAPDGALQIFLEAFHGFVQISYQPYWIRLKGNQISKGAIFQ